MKNNRNLTHENWIMFWDFLVPPLSLHTIKRSMAEEFAPIVVFGVFISAQVYYGLAMYSVLLQYGISMLVQLVFTISIWVILKLVQQKNRRYKYLIACLFTTDANVKVLFIGMLFYCWGFLLITQEMPNSLLIQIVSLILLFFSAMMGWILSPNKVRRRLQGKSESTETLMSSRKIQAITIPITLGLIALLKFYPDKTTIMIYLTNIIAIITIHISVSSIRNILTLLRFGIPTKLGGS